VRCRGWRRPIIRFLGDLQPIVFRQRRSKAMARSARVIEDLAATESARSASSKEARIFAALAAELPPPPIGAAADADDREGRDFKAPAARPQVPPGPVYRLQNFESLSRLARGPGIPRALAMTGRLGRRGPGAGVASCWRWRLVQLVAALARASGVLRGPTARRPHLKAVRNGVLAEVAGQCCRCR